MSRKSIFLMVWLLVVGVAAGSALAELIAHYPFEEGQGTTTVDATGNGNDGTLNSGVEWVTGYKGGAVHFDTAGERIVIGPLDPTARNNAMTLAAWINWQGRNHSISQQGIIGKRLGWSTTGDTIKWFWQTNPAGDFLFRADYDGGGTSFGWGNALLVPYANEWAHVAVTWDNGAGVQYINGEQVSTGNATLRESANATPVTIGCVDSTNTETFVGTIDEVRIYDTALTAEELAKAMSGDYTSSSAPNPSDGATDVPQDVIMSWSPGDFAAAHDVYFGTSAADVEAASRANPMGVLLSQGQTGTTYDPPGLLPFEGTFYWRVDEVNAPPDSSIFKGLVWSFTVEPYVYPIANIKATASAADEGSGPEKTIDGSGLNAAGQHSIDAADMWLASATDGTPVWIQYEFDGIYQLYDMQVWNYNVQFERVLGLGLKDVTIEYSLDGVEWTTFGDVEFAKSTSRSDYVANTTVDPRDVTARFVRFTVQSNWNMGSIQQYGLSEVRFTYLPVKAREPQPAAGQADVALDVTLDWRNGRQAAAHELYFSADRAAVVAGTALIDTLDESRYSVSGLDFGSIYYWKVNEVNEIGPSFWEGDIWSFSTIEFAMVEDFESYTDDIDAGQAIFDTWLDGWVNNTGSTVGYLETPFAERRIVHSGAQSMPLQYDNATSPFYSETQREFETAQNWTAYGADTLALHFQGRPEDNAADTLYIAVADAAGRMSVITHPAGEDATLVADWQEWRIPFSDLSGVDLSRVDTIYIGIGDRANPTAGGAGTVYIDSIQIGHSGSSDPGTSGLAAWYSLENGAEDGSGNGRDGTVMGEPVAVDGPEGLGAALLFDGTGSQYVHLGTWNPSAATGQLSVALWARWNGLSEHYQGLIAKRDSWAIDDMMWQVEANRDSGVVSFSRNESYPASGNPVLPIDEWTHVAVTFDGTTARLYVDAQMTGEGAFTFGSDPEAAVVFGASQGNGENPFNGALDEVRIYDRALSPFEINHLAGK